MSTHEITLAEYEITGGAISGHGTVEYIGQVPNRPASAVKPKRNRVELNIDFAKVAQMEAELAAGTYYTFDFESQSEGSQL